MEKVSREKMSEIDRRAIEECGLSPSVLMELAGFQVADFIRSEFSENIKIALICGPGHNGGDGLVTARRLSSWGFNVEAHVVGEELAEVTERKRMIGENSGLSINKGDFPTANVYVDALVGYNLDSAPREPVKSAVEKINDWGAEAVSIDVPTGVDADTGERYSPHVSADFTVCLGMPKKKLYPRNSGKIYLADIGIPRKAVENSGADPGEYFKEGSLIEYMDSDRGMQ